MRKTVIKILLNQGLIDYDKQLEILGLTKDGLKDMKVLKKKISVHTSELEKL